MSSVSTALVQAERDALACLGLFAHAFARFDPPVAYPGEPAPSHVAGLNIHAAVLDNVDGELLATDHNSIHSDGSPLQHGEQRALRFIDTSVEAAKTLVDQLNPRDRMAVVTDDVKLLVDFNGDKAQLKSKLETLKRKVRMPEAMSGWFSGHSLQYSALRATNSRCPATRASPSTYVVWGSKSYYAPSPE